MPRTIFFEPESGRSGIKIVYWTTTRKLAFSGHYDTYVGIEGGELTLVEFCERLGITRKDLEHTIRQMKRPVPDPATDE